MAQPMSVISTSSTECKQPKQIILQTFWWHENEVGLSWRRILFTGWNSTLISSCLMGRKKGGHVNFNRGSFFDPVFCSCSEWSRTELLLETNNESKRKIKQQQREDHKEERKDLEYSDYSATLAPMAPSCLHEKHSSTVEYERVASRFICTFEDEEVLSLPFALWWKFFKKEKSLFTW